MLSVEGLKKRYETSAGTPAGGVFGVDFEVAKGEFFTLLGPSGCGKTTTLRSIAGLEEPDSGRIVLAGDELFNSASRRVVQPFNRDIGMVFQSYAIWPHMTVFENAAYPLRVSKSHSYSKDEIFQRVSRTLNMVGMEKYIDRASTQLSGGQQQRLALARALAREPKLLLLDEPLSNLDAQLREQMRSELKRLQKEWGVTSIYVTHDQSEALSMSDRIAVMNEGAIVQLGTPREIYSRPLTQFVANFIGRSNVITGRLTADATTGSFQKVTSPAGDLLCFFTAPASAGSTNAVVVRPESVVLVGAGTQDQGLPTDNRLSGVICTETYIGESSICDVRLDSGDIFTVSSVPDDALRVNDRVTLRFPASKTVAIVTQ